MQITKRLPYYATVVLLAYMPFHIFLAQSLSLLTGGLDIWKVAKDALTALVTLFVICILLITRRASKTFYVLTGFLGVYAALHAGLWLTHPDIYKQSAILGSVYNIRLLCFLLLGYGAVRLYPGMFPRRIITRLVVGAAALVAILGLVQYFLPPDTLTHVGYGIDRGARANFAIDDAAGFTRIMSTLRDPNSLGAYLIVPMGIVALKVLQKGSRYRRMMLTGLLGLMAVASLLTFSRSAWMAIAITIGLIALWRYRQMVQMFVKRFGLVVIAVVVCLSVLAYTQRHSSFVTSYITHSSTGSSDIDSNQYHWLFVKQGIDGIIAQPFGHGPGTAGLASIQNPHGSFLTENYYVQIGYELGVVGLLFFVAVQVWIYARLWRQRQDSMVIVLLASFWGYVLMNMLLHTWSNEAVACQWWVLAGIGLALAETTSLPPVRSSGTEKSQQISS